MDTPHVFSATDRVGVPPGSTPQEHRHLAALSVLIRVEKKEEAADTNHFIGVNKMVCPGITDTDKETLPYGPVSHHTREESEGMEGIVLSHTILIGDGDHQSLIITIKV